VAARCDYLENKVIDWLLRGQAFAPPATVYFAAIIATRGYSNTVRGGNIAQGDTILPAALNGRIYKCTQAGVAGAGEPNWSTVNGGVTNDGTAVWTEQTPSIEAGTFTEPAGGSYARASVLCSLANMSGTQGAGSTTPSSGSSGTSSNNNVITYPAPTGAWGLMWGIAYMDAPAAGNALAWAALATPRQVNAGDAAPSFPAASLQFQVDN
jgi:hypothetical protein